MALLGPPGSIERLVSGAGRRALQAASGRAGTCCCADNDISTAQQSDCLLTSAAAAAAAGVACLDKDVARTRHQPISLARASYLHPHNA